MEPAIDAEFSSLIPPLSAEEYTQLEANILAEGCRDPLVIWNGTLIDGHNRLGICTKHNIPYTVTERDFPSRDDALRYIILNQFGRRNLSLGNRSLLALKLEPLYKEKGKSNQQKSPGRGKKGTQNSADLLTRMETRREIAKIAGVSHDTVDKVKRIVEKGTPEQVTRVKLGGKGNSVSAVFKEVRKAALPDTGSHTDTAGENNRLTESKGSAAADTGGEEDDLKRIRGYVADLKNPDLNRFFTTEMFLAEYEAFAERFIRSIGAFKNPPYKETYPLLSGSEKKIMSALNNAMLKAVQYQNSMISEVDSL